MIGTDTALFNMIVKTFKILAQIFQLMSCNTGKQTIQTIYTNVYILNRDNKVKFLGLNSKSFARMLLIKVLF